MIENNNYDKTYRQVDFSTEELPGKEFDGCKFINCSFANSNIGETDFLDCDFENCNFVLTKPAGTGLKDVRFKSCKLMGFDFSLCSDFLFQVDFDNCQLDYALFTKKKMKKTRFANSSLVQNDFSECILTEAIFESCTLTDSTFFRTNLEKADFRTAVGYAFDPNENRIKKAKFSSSGLAGLLSKYNILVEE